MTCYVPRVPVARSMAPVALFLATAWLVMPAMPASAQTPRPAVGPERPFVPPPRIEHILRNGLQVVIVPFSTVPKVTAVLTIRSGLAADAPEKPGLAQFVVDAAQEGTSSRTSRQIRQEVFAMGASLSASAGQDTSSFTTRGLTETLPQMVALLADIARHPTFPQEEVDLLKSTTAQGLQAQLASPQLVANRIFRQTLFGSHPYARVGATVESVPAIDRDSIVRYHSTYYRPNNAFLVVAGDVTREAVIAAADRSFADWAQGAVPTLPSPPLSSPRGRKVVFVQRPNSVQSSISVGNLAIKRNDQRWHVMQLANQIYGGAFDSRLVRNIREEKGYTYSPGSIFQAMAQAGLYRATADVRNEVTGATLKEIFGEINNFRAGGPEAAELEAAKTYMRGLFVIQNATQSGLAGTLNTVYGFDLPKDYPETFQKTVTGLSAEAVKTAAGMLLGAEDSVIVVVGDYAKVKDQLTEFPNIVFMDINGHPIPVPQ